MSPFPTCAERSFGASNPDLWINLGAMYGRFDRHEEALASYQIASNLIQKSDAFGNGEESARDGSGH